MPRGNTPGKRAGRLLKNSLPARDGDFLPRIKHCKCLMRCSRVRTCAAPGALKNARKAFFNILLGYFDNEYTTTDNYGIKRKPTE